MHKTSIIFIIFLSFLISSAKADEISKGQWIGAMSTTLPTAFCNSQQYFRQCFNVSAIECEETAVSATRICLKKYQDEIPEILNQPQDGEHWGSIIGGCAGEAYEVALIKKRKDNERCNDIKNWQ